MHQNHSILIVDHEPSGRSQLRRALEGLHTVFPHQVVGEVSDAASALREIDALHPHLVLVDAALPGMSGIELARRLDQASRPRPSGNGHAVPAIAMPALIYVSGSPRYAVDAFDVHAVDYLLKPVDAPRLLRALRRIDEHPSRHRYGLLRRRASDTAVLAAPSETPSEASSSTISAAPSSAPAERGAVGPEADPPSVPRPGGATPSMQRTGAPEAEPLALPAPIELPALPAPSRVPRRHFAVHERGRLMLVPVEQVVYLKAELKYVTVRTRQREYLIEDSLVSIEAEFPERFVRVHRNALVARASIAGFERMPASPEAGVAEAHWQVVLRDVPDRLPVSRRQWSVLRNLIG